MGREWKRRKKYNPKQRKVERSHKKIYFNLTNVVKREAIFTVVSIILLTLVTLSGTYAIFSSVQKAEDYNTLKVGTLKIEYKDTESGMGNIINLNGAYPVSDSEGLVSVPYTFRITNTGTLRAKYNVKILDDEEMIAEDGCSDKLLPKNKIKYNFNSSQGKLLSTTEANNYIINTGYLESGESKVYNIRVWIDSSAGNEVLGTHFHGKIVVDAINDFDEITANDGILMSSTGTTDSRAYYAFRTIITKVVLGNEIVIPTDGSIVEGPWDVSETQDGTVQAYCLDDGNGGLILHIQTNGNIILPPNCTRLFYFFGSLEAIENTQYLDSSQVTSMDRMFQFCASLSEIDLTSFVTTNVTNMNFMFQNTPNLILIRVSIGKWDESNATVDNMFVNSGTTSVTYE